MESRVGGAAISRRWIPVFDFGRDEPWYIRVRKPANAQQAWPSCLAHEPEGAQGALSRLEGRELPRRLFQPARGLGRERKSSEASCRGRSKGGCICAQRYLFSLLDRTRVTGHRGRGKQRRVARRRFGRRRRRALVSFSSARDCQIHATGGP